MITETEKVHQINNCRQPCTTTGLPLGAGPRIGRGPDMATGRLGESPAGRVRPELDPLNKAREALRSYKNAARDAGSAGAFKIESWSPASCSLILRSPRERASKDAL